MYYELIHVKILKTKTIRKMKKEFTVEEELQRNNKYIHLFLGSFPTILFTCTISNESTLLGKVSLLCLHPLSSDLFQNQ